MTTGFSYVLPPSRAAFNFRHHVVDVLARVHTDFA